MTRKAGGAASIEAALERRLPRLAAAYREARGERGGRAAAPLSAAEVSAAGAALLRLQRGLTGERSLAGAAYMDDPELLGAYLLYYWPASYIQAALALAELGLEPRRVLDLGSGPGPAAAAALDAAQGRAERLVLADGSRAALELARRVLEPRPGAPEPSPESSFDYRELDLEDERALRGASLGADGGFDLVVLGHCLNELWRGREDRLERRLELLESAAGLLEPDGALLVLEPALLATSREALELRDELASRGYRILGPCPGSYPCPALAAGPDRTCHSEAPWDPPESVAALAKAAGLDRRSVKWTYFSARKGPEKDVDRARASPNALLGRVVSDPMLNKAGRVRYFLCAEGRLATLSAARDSAEARSSGFLDLRRGDRVRVEGAEARPNGGLGLAPSSRLELLSRASRPEGGET